MKISKLLLIPLFIFTWVIMGCDNENSSKAQDMDTPGPVTTDCPCFTMDQVTDTSMSSDVGCENTVWGLNLTPSPEIENVVQLIAECGPDGTNCQCLGPLSNQELMDVSLAEGSLCMNMLINGLVTFGRDSVSASGCIFVPVSN